jgi:hypothetical protein
MASDRRLSEKLKALVTGDPFAGPFWPLSLELTHLGVGNADWEKADTLAPLRALHKAKISIIDWAAPPKVFAMREALERNEQEPQYAIEAERRPAFEAHMPSIWKQPLYYRQKNRPIESCQ